MSTTQKHRDFVQEPMGNRSVRDLPGVGPSIGQKLERQGVDKAKHVLGQYLTHQDKPAFQGWMKDACQANSKQSSDCYNGLDAWANEWL